MTFNDLYGDPSSSGSLDFFTSMLGNAAALGVITIICLLFSVIGGIVLYFTFLSKKNENKFQKNLGWLYNFLNFKSMFAESLLKIGYLISTIFIILFQLGVLFFTEGGSIGGKLFGCLIGLVVWNVIVRLTYEFMLVTLVICRNTTEINKTMQNNSVKNVSNHGKLESAEIGVVFCRNCGNKYNSTESVCSHCGANK